jgi:hypothetical protein
MVALARESRVAIRLRSLCVGLEVPLTGRLRAAALLTRPGFVCAQMSKGIRWRCAAAQARHRYPLYWLVQRPALVSVHRLRDVFRAEEIPPLPVGPLPRAEILMMDRGVDQGSYKRQDNSRAAALAARGKHRHPKVAPYLMAGQRESRRPRASERARFVLFCKGRPCPGGGTDPCNPAFSLRFLA